jgi:Icc-related predicted phosphoesterase
MKIVAISDTHGKHRAIDLKLIPADTDMLIHAGDMTWTGEYDILADFNSWLDRISWVKHKIVIGGNHDQTLERNRGLAQTILSNAHYLEDDMIEIDGLTIYGSPWAPRFGNWGFYADRGPEMAKKWRHLTSGQVKPDILLTHTPPYGILDQVSVDEHVGCEELIKAVAIVRPRLHIFGHIHEGYGRYRVDKTLFVNAAICDGSYNPINKPQVITL